MASPSPATGDGRPSDVPTPAATPSGNENDVPRPRHREFTSKEYADQVKRHAAITASQSLFPGDSFRNLAEFLQKPFRNPRSPATAGPPPNSNDIRFAALYQMRDNKLACAPFSTVLEFEALGDSVFPGAVWDREILLLNLANHAHVVKLVRPDKIPYHRLLLEYVPLGNLWKQRRERRFSDYECAQLLHQCALGLGHIHSGCSQPLIHRDLSPNNILVQSRDPLYVQLSDFGVSKAVDDDYAYTVIGTRPYRAQEDPGKGTAMLLSYFPNPETGLEEGNTPSRLVRGSSGRRQDASPSRPKKTRRSTEESSRSRNTWFRTRRSISRTGRDSLPNQDNDGPCRSGSDDLGLARRRGRWSTARWHPQIHTTTFRSGSRDLMEIGADGQERFKPCTRIYNDYWDYKDWDWTRRRPTSFTTLRLPSFLAGPLEDLKNHTGGSVQKLADKFTLDEHRELLRLSNTEYKAKREYVPPSSLP